MTRLLIHSSVLALIFMVISCSVNSSKNEESTCDYRLYPPEDTVIASHNEWTQSHYQERIKAFKQDSIYPNSIVMLGNSLTEQGGNWEERLNAERVANRGIAGDNTDGVLARLGEIQCAEPVSIFLMIGTNDLWTNYSVDEVAANIKRIGDTLANSLRNTEVYVQTVMPLEEGHNQSQRLKDINEQLKSAENSNYTLIDTFSEMAGENGALPSNYTTDGVHLTKAGYDKWVSVLLPYVE